jgi:Tfp pilus assembly protein PilF/O-antigen ligase
MDLAEKHSKETPAWAGSDWPARLLESLWLLAAVAVPLAINPWGSNAFELPKALLLRMLVLLMVLAALAKTISAPGTAGNGLGFRAWRTGATPRWRAGAPLLVPTLLFGLALALATAFSVAPETSLWGSLDRQQGLLTLGAYLGLFLLTAANLRSREQVERLWTALVWGSAPVVVYGLLQAAGFDPLGWRTDAVSPVLSTLGRANFVGSYLVLVLPLTVGRAILARRRWPYLLLLVGQLACLALTQARAAWLGLVVALVTVLLAWALTSRQRKRNVAALVLAVLILGLLAVGFVTLLNTPGSPFNRLARLSGVDRLASLADVEAGSSAARLTTWRAALPLVVEGGALGYGPETMRPVFARVFPPELVYYQGRHVTVDRAHNLWLDLGMSAGLAGIAGLLAILVGWAWLAWRGLPGRRDRWGLVAWAVLVAAVIGHLVELQFSFDLTASATVFWLVLAMGAGLWAARPQGDRAGATAGGRQLLPMAPVVLLALVLAWLVCARPLLADVAYQRTQEAGSAPDERLAASARAVDLWPLEPVYRLELAWNQLQQGDAPAAEAQLAAALEGHDHDPGVWAAIGGLYARWGEVEPGRFVQSEAAYRQALDLAPNTASFHVALGLVLARQGRLEEALIKLERAVALDATDSVAYRHLADLYSAVGQDTQAIQAQWQAERWEKETRAE